MMTELTDHVPVVNGTTSEGHHSVTNGNPPPAPAEMTFPTRKPGQGSTTGARAALRHVTVEPVLFFFMFALGINYPALHALIYKKVCLQRFTHNTTICDNLHQEIYSEYEDQVQSDASHWVLYEHLAFEIPSLILSFFYGALSDHVGRKLTLALPCIGQALSMANYVIQSALMDAHVGYILIGRLISGVFGGWIGCCLASFSYLSAVTAPDKRTIRIAIAEGCISLSISVSFFISGVVLDNTSFEFVFGLACATNVVATIYIIVWVKEPENERPIVLSAGETVTVCSQMWVRVKEAVLCVFRKREGNNRKHLLVLLAATLTGMISYAAMWTLGYLYLRRQPLSWSQTTYGILVGTRTLVTGTALFTIVPFLIKKLHFTDTGIIIVALVSSAVSEAYFGICNKTWMVFLLPIFACMADAKMTCMRSQLTHFVQPEEFGRMFAAVGCIQSISGILGTLLYNTIYPLTLHVWAGLCFLLGAVITIIPIGLVTWLHFDLKKEITFTELQEETDDATVATRSSSSSTRRRSNSSLTERSPLKSRIFSIYNSDHDVVPDYRVRLRFTSGVF